jgi:hypothetical protein
MAHPRDNGDDESPRPWKRTVRVRFVSTTTRPTTTEHATTEPVTTEPATTEPATTEPATTEPATTNAPAIESTGNESNTNPTPSTTAPDFDYLDWPFDGVPEGFKVSEYTDNVNRMVAAVRGGLRPKTAAELQDDGIEPTLSFLTQPTLPEIPENNQAAAESEEYKWEDAPVVQSRRFKAIRVEEVEALVKAAGEREGEHKACWMIWVQDQLADDSPELHLYGAAPHPKTAHGARPSKYIGGSLTRAICADREQVRQLGDFACKLMDRLPLEIDPRR